MSPNFGEHAQQIRDSLQKTHPIARQHTQRNAKRRKDYYDRRSNLTVFQINDKVWYQSGPKKDISPKLQSLYTGPYLIIRKFNDINYEIQLDEIGTKKLKTYNGDNIPKWMKTLIKKKDK